MKLAVARDVAEHAVVGRELSPAESLSIRPGRIEPAPVA
jgi:hypothetical protein